MAGAVDLLTAGGPILLLLVCLSFFSIALIVAKVLQLRRATSGARARAEAIADWSGGKPASALAKLEQGSAPADRILLLAMQGLASGTHSSVLEADLEWRGNAEVAEMSRHVRLLELIGMIAPLLGLLGTVLGMIRSFQDLAGAEGSANASILASGIWEALLTTAAGLVVAIPASVAAGLLGERVERAAFMIESAVGQLLTAAVRAPGQDG